MKQVNEMFDDKEHAAIVKIKKMSGAKNWHDFIIRAAQALKLELSEQAKRGTNNNGKIRK